MKAQHFLWEQQGKVGIITLNRPDKKNPLTFESYAELRDSFLSFSGRHDLKAIVIAGAGGNFCSGGDVHEIIGPLVKMKEPELLKFTRMTGDLIKAMRDCPQIIVAAIDGICAGAGAAIAMASDLRIGSSESKVAFLFCRVGLAGADMGACAILPRIIGHGRASELLFSGRSVKADEAERIGFYNKVVQAQDVLSDALELANSLANGPSFAHSMTKKMLNREWNMSINEAIDAEAQAQAICMQTQDFKRAYQAFVEKRKPEFEGN